MLEQYVESLTDLIEALDGIEDRALNEKSYNFFIGSIKEEYEKILEESSIEKLYHEAVAIGTTKEELVNDMMMLIASFSGRLYSARAKKRKQEI